MALTNNFFVESKLGDNFNIMMKKYLTLFSGLIYWTDTAERTISRATKSGKNIETIIGKGLHTADGIVIDSTGRKIYWTDGGRNSVEVAELDGSNRKVLVWTGLGMIY